MSIPTTKSLVKSVVTMSPREASGGVHSSTDPLVIGLAVDFGMTGSGFIFVDKKRDGKIPTTISYDEEGRVADWGFGHDQDRPRSKHLFKSLLNPQIWNTDQQLQGDSQRDPESLGEVRDCVRDYLTLLLERALRIISNETKSCDLVINLTLTRPTTWAAAVVENYRSIAGKAFETVAQRCSSNFSLRLNSLRDETESHAAGVFIFENNKRYPGEKGSIFCVVDVGGAITDPALLQAVCDSSGNRKLKSLLNPPIPGIPVGCADLDNLFSDQVVRLLRSLWEQKNIGSNIEKYPSVLSMLTSTAKTFRFGRQWITQRHIYSEGTAFPHLKLTIPAIPSDEKDELHGFPKSSIIITRSQMKAIFDTALITPIREHLSEILTILKSLQSPQEAPFKIAHIMLCGGGGLIPRVYECVGDQMGTNVSRTTNLMAPSLGALYLVRDEVRRMHATIKVGTKKLGSGAGDILWLTGVMDGDSLTPMFSRQWKHRIRPEVAVLRQHFVLVFEDEFEPRARTENWAVQLQLGRSTPRSRFGLFQNFQYRICLTLPSTTDVVTPMDFSVFQINKDGGKIKIEYSASKAV